MPENASKAVFLSYASQDADVVRRIADVLKTAGAEVWLDQSELVGGDAWDARIRRQIKECALFVPIISANTQARPEGYFRLEWHLAEQRTQLMAHDQAFLLPVVIDDTTDAAARVPEKFRTVQWTRLPQGATTAAFQARVRGLLGLAGADKAATTPAADFTGAPVAARRRNRLRLTAGAFAVLLAGAGIYFVLHLAARGTSPATASDKSVAVLPFANMSGDRDNAYFADGVQEDILTSIALNRELRVVSRTSVVQFRDSKLSMRQIGEALRVSYILEGSVRGRANKVHMSVRLINARTDEPVWGNTFERDLSDLFDVQTELGKEIAAAMQAAIASSN